MINIALASCNKVLTIKDSGNRYKTKVITNKNDSKSKQNTIPYLIAEHYFVKNTFKGDHFSEAKIVTQAKFNELFDAAVVMGANGKPTSIDFTKQYVIAVTDKETDIETSMIPKSLTNDGKNIVFKYEIKKGNKTTFSMKPFLMIVVDNKYQGTIKVQSSEVK